MDKRIITIVLLIGLIGLNAGIQKDNLNNDYISTAVFGFNDIENIEKIEKAVHKMPINQYLELTTFENESYMTIKVSRNILELKKNPLEEIVIAFGVGLTKQGELDVIRNIYILITDEIFDTEVKLPIFKSALGNDDNELNKIKITLGFYNKDGGRYRVYNSVTIFTPNIDDSVYIESNYLINYNDAPKTKELAQNFRDESITDEQFIMKTFIFVSEMEYDYELLEQELNSIYYKPEPDEILEKNKGICSEQAKLLAALLRSQGIPTKYVSGMAGGGHAWNEILINGEWIPVDPTAKSFNITDEYEPQLVY